MESINDITYEMIEEMQHCIGFRRNIVTGTKHRVMHAYRNHFCDHIDNKKWNELVKLGLAYVGQIDYETGVCFYHLTQKGLNFIAKLCGFENIVETN